MSACCSTTTTTQVVGGYTTCVRCDTKRDLQCCIQCCDGICTDCSNPHDACECQENEDGATPEDLAFYEVVSSDKKRERGPESVYIIEDDKSQVIKYPGWLPEAERATLFQNLTAEVLPLMTHDKGVFMGKPWTSKRLVATISTHPGVSYSYSSVKRKSLDVTFAALPWLEALRVRMEALCGHALNFVFINWYRPNTDDQLGFHADDETDMTKGASIVSLSVGDTRHFAFRKKGETKIHCQTPLNDGDVAIMQGETQSHYQHAITSKGSKKCTRGRWNLTFRLFN